jgi:hypothetical protein
MALCTSSRNFKPGLKIGSTRPAFSCDCVIAIHFLLRLAHNFSFGVDFTTFATQNVGTS